MYAAMTTTAQGRLRSAATIRRVHGTLRSALNSAVKRRLIAWSPAVHVELPSPDAPEAAVWSPDEVETFLKAHADHRLYALFHLIVVAGLRRGEALGLRWVDVDLGQCMIRVRQQLLDAPGSPVFGPTKTRSGVRRVPLDAATIDVIEAHRPLNPARLTDPAARTAGCVSGLVLSMAVNPESRDRGSEILGANLWWQSAQ